MHLAVSRPGFKVFIRPSSEMLHPDRFLKEAVGGYFFMEEAERTPRISHLKGCI